MACSCRTSALQMFVRSLTEVHAPNNTFARTAWHSSAHSQMPLRTTRLNVPYRQFHASAPARNSAHPDAVDKAPSGTVEQPTPRVEEGSSAQPQTKDLTAEDHVVQDNDPQNPLLEDDKSSKSARKRERLATKPYKFTELPAVFTGGNKESQVKEPFKFSKIVVDETRGSKIPKRRAAPEEWKKKDDRPAWAKQKDALKTKFPEGWMPRKKLSPDALAGIRALHQQFPDVYTTQALSEKFEMSPEAIRRILRSKWEPSPEEEEDRQQRWFNRGLSVWDRYAELGKTPPKKWQEAGVKRGPWNRRREEDGEDEGEQEVDQEKLRRLRAQLKLAKSLM